MNTPTVLDFREDDFCISDPERVSLILIALELPELLRPASQAEEPAMSFVGYVAHPTHWLLICSFKGVPEMKNKGLTIIGKSKRLNSIGVLDGLVAYFTKGAPCYARPDAKFGPSHSS